MKQLKHIAIAAGLTLCSLTASAQWLDLLVNVSNAVGAATPPTETNTVAKDSAVTPSKSPVELRQIQSREFKTTDAKKVMSVIEEAFMDLGWKGAFGSTSGHFSFQVPKCTSIKSFGAPEYFIPCTDTATVLVKSINEKKVTVVRISIDHGEFKKSTYETTNVIDEETYNKLYQVISKSLFLEAQQLDAKSLQ